MKAILRRIGTVFLVLAGVCFGTSVLGKEKNQDPKFVQRIQVVEEIPPAFVEKEETAPPDPEVKEETTEMQTGTLVLEPHLKDKFDKTNLPTGEKTSGKKAGEKKDDPKK